MTNEETTTIDLAALNAPFETKDVSFRIQTMPKDGKTRALVVAYVDARAVSERLDEVCGKDGWSFDWQPILTGTISGKPAVLAAKGILTIGGVSKADVGDAGDTEPTKASVSDSLKRAAVLWGIGRYLYDMPKMYAETVKYGNSTYLKDGEEERLRREYLTGKAKPAPVEHTRATNIQTSATPASFSNGNNASGNRQPAPNPRKGEPQASEQQMTSIRKLCTALGKPEPAEALTYAEAREVISQLSNDYQRARRKEGGGR